MRQIWWSNNWWSKYDEAITFCCTCWIHIHTFLKIYLKWIDLRLCVAWVILFKALHKIVSMVEQRTGGWTGCGTWETTSNKWAKNTDTETRLRYKLEQKKQTDEIKSERMKVKLRFDWIFSSRPKLAWTTPGIMSYCDWDQLEIINRDRNTQ